MQSVQISKAQQLKNESFYTKKRCLLRKAEQIYKYCNSDVFIVIHKHDTDRVFSFTTNQNFELSSVAKLLHKDVNDRVQVRKIQKFFQPEIAQINHRIEQIQNILEQQDDISSDRSSSCEYYRQQDKSLSTNAMSSNGQSAPSVNQVSTAKAQEPTNYFCAPSSQSTQEQQYEVQSKISSCQDQTAGTLDTPQSPKITMFDIDNIVTDSNSIEESSPLTPRHSECHVDTNALSDHVSSPAAQTCYTIAELVVGNNCSPSSQTCCQSPKFTSNCDYLTNENSSSNSCQSPQQLPSSPRCAAVPKDNATNIQISQFDQFEDHKSDHIQSECPVMEETQEQQENNTVDFNNDQILDCDDIMMFNNWDDVRQNQEYDNNAYLFAQQF